MGKGDKGSDYEREICRVLSKWWGCGEDTFWRNRVRKTTKGAGNQCGDITSLEGDGHIFVSRYNIECKKGYSTRKLPGTSTRINWDILDMVDGRAEKPIFMDFWNQCLRDSELSGRVPMLIFRRHLRADVIVIPSYELGLMRQTLGATLFAYVKKVTWTLSPGNTLLFFRLEDFLSHLDSKGMRKHIQKFDSVKTGRFNRLNRRGQDEKTSD